MAYKVTSKVKSINIVIMAYKGKSNLLLTFVIL